MIAVLFFGPVAERACAGRVEVAFQAGMRIQDLRDALRPRYPAAFALVSLVAVNGEHVRDMSIALVDGSEVAFMSSFSGG